PGTAAGEKRLEDVLQDLRGHPAPGIGKHQLGHEVPLGQGDRQGPAVVHTVQGVHHQVQDDRFDLLGVDPGHQAAFRLEPDDFTPAILEVLYHVEHSLDQVAQVGRFAAAFAAAAEF